MVEDERWRWRRRKREAERAEVALRRWWVLLNWALERECVSGRSTSSEKETGEEAMNSSNSRTGCREDAMDFGVGAYGHGWRRRKKEKDELPGVSNGAKECWTVKGQEDEPSGEHRAAVGLLLYALNR